MSYQLVGFNTYETKWGIGAAIFSKNGLTGIVLPQKNEALLREEIAWEFGPINFNEALGKDITSTLELYFKGERVQFSYQLDYRMPTQFTRQIYDNLKAIPYGETITYKELAALCGRPNAARAVGNAMAKNTIPIVVPCHRVLKSDGSIGGWSGKPNWKERLLAIEGYNR